LGNTRQSKYGIVPQRSLTFPLLLQKLVVGTFEGRFEPAHGGDEEIDFALFDPGDGPRVEGGFIGQFILRPFAVGAQSVHVLAEPSNEFSLLGINDHAIA
jgi:hypothetical protein